MNLSQLKIDGFNAPFGDNEDIFLMDLWNVEEGLLYLLGLKSIALNDSADMMFIETLGSEKYEGATDSELMSDIISKLQRLQNFWYNFPHMPSNPPKYFINWGLSKRIEIPWLEFAVQKKYYFPENNLSENDTLHIRLENNYLRLIFSLCYEMRGFNPNDKPNTIAKLIKDTTGIKISQETLAKYIDKAQTLSLSEV